MISKKELGNIGESLAISFLKEKGYEILEQNYRYGRAEIDLIAKVDELLIFIEVKTRSNTYYGRPEEYVTLKQQELIANAASFYMEEVNHQWEVRFDIVSIVYFNPSSYTIDHLKDAFFPGLE